MHSWDGLGIYSLEWFIVVCYDLLMPVTLFVPIDIWIAMFATSWDGIDRWFLWYMPWAFGLNTITGLVFDYPSEDGWGMLWN